MGNKSQCFFFGKSTGGPAFESPGGSGCCRKLGEAGVTTGPGGKGDDGRQKDCNEAIWGQMKHGVLMNDDDDDL